jgi:hypothetical protein
MFRALFLFISLASSIQAQDFKAISEHPRWKAMLHYSWGLTGYVSEASSENFFFAKDGKKNLESELKATLEAMRAPVDANKLDDHATCRFPARKLFIEEQLGIRFISQCPGFEAFKARLNARSLSLVFSSYFLDTPASAYGHTFIRYIKNPEVTEARGYELLDYATNYAASVTTSNALLYAILGVAGGFKGEYASMPYFYKVREYNDYESRDLWDYEINITPKQLDYAIAHNWEMGQTHFPYFYLTGNCSYHMLALLNVANPDWNLLKRTPFFVLPVDTVKVLVETPGLLKKVSYRPSKRKILQARLATLDGEQTTLVSNAMKTMSPESLPANLSHQEKAVLLDTLIDFVDYRLAKDLVKEDAGAMNIKRNFLIARSQIPLQTPEPKLALPQNESPHLGHGSRRLGIFFGDEKHRETFYQAEFRFALHDFLDPTIGQNTLAKMEMGNIKLRHYTKDNGHTEIDEAWLMSVTSLSPVKRFFTSTSWRFRAGARTVRDIPCGDCLAPTIELGGGLSYRWQAITTLLFIDTELEAHKRLSHRGGRVGLGPLAAVYVYLPYQWQLGLEGTVKRRFLGEKQWTSLATTRLRGSLTSNIAVDFSWKEQEKYRDFMAGFYFYY